MKKEFKKIIAIIICISTILNCANYAAIVSDNDGSAFITKAEFESLKTDFNTQIDNYNYSIDNKIDGAIAAYLAGIKLSEQGLTTCFFPGIQWSIGPFDRPRFKNGSVLFNLFNKRRHYNSSRTIVTETTQINNWGSYADSMTEFEPEKVADNMGYQWVFRDIILKDVYDYDANFNLVSSPAAELDGVYSNSSHYYSYSTAPLVQSTHYDNVRNWNAYSELYGGLSLRYKSTQGLVDNPTIDFRVGVNNISGLSAVNPSVSFSTSFKNGVSNSYSLVKGSRLFWNNNITAFAPIEYHCFNKEQNGTDYGPGYRNKGIRDEILYNIVNLDNGTSMNKNDGTWNPLYYNFPDLANAYAHRNLWGLTATQFQNSSAISKLYNSVLDSSTKDSKSYVKEMKMYLGRGYQNTDANWTVSYKYYYQPDVRFTGISNWNQVGHKIDISLLNYIKNLDNQNAIIKSKTQELFSLASGLPVCLLNAKSTTKIEATFRATPSYAWKNKKNDLDKSTIDSKNAYVVYAKTTPFSKDLMPEDENNLLDISNGDEANKGKLKKCLIVRDGKLNFEVNNTSTFDTYLFLKWEKLSNWMEKNSSNQEYVTRKEDYATNYDVHKEGSNTEVITTPKWTYFGGGFLMFPDEFVYSSNY